MGDGSDTLGGARAIDADTEITLGVLTAVEGNSAVSQRALARELGIALGLVNAYLKRCVRKGHIKVKQIPPNRYAYYITPKGFGEKSRLTVEYLSCSLSFFRDARRQCAECLDEGARRGWRRMALIGAGELAEIAALCAREAGPRLVAVVDAEGGRVAGLPTVPALADLGSDPGPIDGCLITDVRAPQAAYDGTVAILTATRVLAPPLLNISREAPKARPGRSRPSRRSR